VDVSTEVLRLRRAAPDFAIFHGYVMAPIPEFIGQARQAGMTTTFMNTFYPTDNVILKRMGAVADGMLGVTQLQFPADPNAKGATMDLIRQLNPGKERSTSYLYSWLVGQIAVEALKRVFTAGKQPTAQNTIEALRGIKDYDTGGLVGVPVSVVGNSLPVGRIYRANGQTLSYSPASDWIKVR
jgi:branched-chain amino acid transport system substrate-binding protein